MPRVMTLGNLPLAGAYRAAPVRRLSGLGSFADDCNDPAFAIFSALGSGIGGALSTATGDADDAQAARAAGALASGFSTGLRQQCEAARRAAAAGDPTAAASLQALLDLERARNASVTLTLAQQQAQAREAAANQSSGSGEKDKTPYYVVGGLAVAGVIAAALILR